MPSLATCMARFPTSNLVRLSRSEGKKLHPWELSINHHIPKRYNDCTNVVVTLARLINIVDESETSALYVEFSGQYRDVKLSRLLSLTTQGLLDNSHGQAEASLVGRASFEQPCDTTKYDLSSYTLVMDASYCDTLDACHTKRDNSVMEQYLHKWPQQRETNVAFHQVRGTHNNVLRGSKAFSL